MPKSADQIRRDYAKQGILSQIGTAAADIGNIGGNAIGFGLPNRFAEWVMGAPSGAADERTREARVRAGLAGDLTNAAGVAYGLVRGAGAAKGTLTAAKTLPTAAAVAKSAGPVQAAKFLLNKAGPGLVPAAAPIAKGALAKGAGILGLLGLSVASRPGDEGTAGAARTPVPTGPQDPLINEQDKQYLMAPPTVAPQDRAMAAIDTILRQPFTLNEFSAATGALPVVASAAAKQSSKDKVFGAASGIADTLYQAELAKAAALPADQRDEAVLSATEKYRQNLLQTLGVDPSKAALAELMAQAQGGE